MELEELVEKQELQDSLTVRGSSGLEDYDVLHGGHIGEGGYEAFDNMTIEDQLAHVCQAFNASQLMAHNLTDQCAPQVHLPKSFMIFVQVFYALVCILGLCGNTLVIYVVLRYSKMQTVTYIYILMLAVADEIFLLGLPFLIVTLSQKSWIFGLPMCKIYMTTTSINQFTSSIFLTVLSADRYIAVCHPISAPKYRTPVIARCVSLTAWAASALLMVPVFMYAATLTRPDGDQTCNIFWPQGDEEDVGILTSNVTETEDPRKQPIVNQQRAFTIYSLILGFAIPLSLILIFYAQVVFKLRTVGPKSNTAANTTAKSTARKKSHAKVTRLVLTVITVYIFCWLPYWINQLSLIFRSNIPPSEDEPPRDDNLVIVVTLLAGCLSYSNSAVNPVLYAFLSENFKKSFMKACTCANRGDANAALHVEHSLFPRKRTLLGRAREKQREKNAARNKLLNQNKDGAANKKMHNNLEPQLDNKKHQNNPDMICIMDSNEKNEAANDMSTGISVSRTSRSCFNSTAGPTGTTTVPASANVSIAQLENTEAEDVSPKIRVINGNLAPPKLMSKSASSSNNSAEK